MTLPASVICLGAASMKPALQLQQSALRQNIDALAWKRSLL